MYVGDTELLTTARGGSRIPIGRGANPAGGGGGQICQIFPKTA